METTLARSTSAVAKAFNITELVERILLQIPTRDLLLAQRICKTWQNTIETSVNIQKALCLKPTGVFDCPWTRTLPASIISNEFIEPRISSGESAQDFLNEATNDQYHINPLLALFLEEIDADPEQDSYCTVQFKYKPEAPKVHWVKQHSQNASLNGARWMPSSSFFRKTFVTQPPVHKIQYQFCIGFECYTDETVITNHAGITLYDLMSCIEDRQQLFNMSGTPYVLDFIVPV